MLKNRLAHAKFKILGIIPTIVIIIIVVSMLLSPTPSSKVPVAVSQVQNLYWTTLAGDPKRTAFIPRTTGVGVISTPTNKWTYSFTLSEGQFAFNIDHLIVDIDGDGQIEVVTVDSGGRLIVIRGSNGNRLSYSSVEANPFSAPAAGDIDNDNIMEFIMGTKDGCVISVEVNPGANWATNIQWKSVQIDEEVSSSPLLYDLNGDGTLEIIVVTKFGLVSLSPTDGSILWNTNGRGYIIVGSPALLADINGDGVRDIVYSDMYGYVYGISGADGSEIWKTDLWANPTLQYKFVIHSPVVADVDGDGVEEVILSVGKETFASSGGRMVKTGVEGYLAILNSQTGALETVVNPPAGSALFAWVSQPAIAVGDVDGDNIDEIFLGSGDGYIYRIEYSAGSYTVTSLLMADPYWPTIFGTDGAPPVAVALVIVDIDNDGSYELVAVSTDGVSKDNRWGGPRYKIYSLDAQTGTVEWSITVDYNTFGLTRVDDTKFSWPTLSVGDVDGDGNLEVVVSTFQYIYCID